MKKAIDARELYHLITYAGGYLTNFKQQMNEINVFPVQDKDTGSNVCATMQAIIDLSKPGERIKDTLTSIADASLIGARGNSGLIYSQFFNGLIPKDESFSLTTKQFASLVMQAQHQARLAVSEPVEGTVLTLMTHWSSHCKKLAENVDDFKELFKSLITVTKQALENTINQLKVLNQHHVVDAGALSFYYFIEGLNKALHTDISIKPKFLNVSDEQPHDLGMSEKPNFRYCTETIFTSNNLDTAALQQLVAAHGDSIVVSGREDKHRLHIHTDNPAEFFNTLQAHGKFDYPKVEDMLKQFINAPYPKRKMAIVTDSAADIPQALVDNQDFFFVPVNLIMQDNVYLDKVTITSKQLYDLLPTIKDYPQTSLPSNYVAKQLFNYLSSKYENILVLSVSKALSGTHDLIAKVAAEYNNIDVINTRMASGGQGLLACYAADLMNQGLDYASIKTEIEKKLSHTSVFVAVKQVDSLIRSGRVKNLKASVVKLLNIKPIISIDKQGAGTLWGKSFRFNSNVEKILTAIKKQHQHYAIKNYCLMHVNNPDDLQQFQSACEAIVGFSPAYISDVSPAVGLHAGIGCIAIATITEKSIDNR